MTQLSIYGKPLNSIFQLLGDNENDISYSIGWTLFKSPAFLKEFVKTVTNQNYELTETSIRLQAYANGKGFTDFEIQLVDKFYLIIESKRHWNYPPLEQLEKYVSRKDFQESCDPIKKVVVLNDASKEYSQAHFTIQSIGDCEVKAISYREIFNLIKKAVLNASSVEKRLLAELAMYLDPLIAMQNKTSNLVWVVSLGEGMDSAFSSLSFKEVVAQHNIYFHPIKTGFRKEPPNYIAFRYDGKLQAIHHIDSYKAIKNPKEIGGTFNDTELEYTYFVYALGPKIVPVHTVTNGPSIVMANRVECMLDTLLTSSTISEALSLTKERLLMRE